MYLVDNQKTHNRLLHCHKFLHIVSVTFLHNAPVVSLLLKLAAETAHIYILLQWNIIFSIYLYLYEEHKIPSRTMAILILNVNSPKQSPVPQISFKTSSCTEHWIPPSIGSMHFLLLLLTPFPPHDLEHFVHSSQTAQWYSSIFLA